VQGSGGSVANSLIAVDPSSGNIATSIYAGSEPGALAISGDRQRIFTVLGGMPAIVPVNLASQSTEAAYPVGTAPAQYPNVGLWGAKQVASIPGEPRSVVAITGPFNAADYSYCSVAVYDPSGPRPETFTKPVSVIINGDADNAYFAQNDATSDFSLYRLLVTSSGVSLDKQLNSIATSFGAALAYANGYLYNDSGNIYTADTSHIAGSLAAAKGVPVPFPERNMVVYVSIPNYSGIQITAFDLTTFRPTASLFIPERISIWSVSAIRAGSGAIAFIQSQDLVVVPLSALQPVPPQQATLQTVAPGVQKSSIPAYAIAVQPGSGNLVLATPSTASNLGNGILLMDPSSGSVLASTFAGSEPSLLAVSADGRYAYSYLGGAGNLARFDLVAGTRDLVFSGDLTGQGQPVDVWDLCVGPDGGLAVSYVGGAVAIFDSGVPRTLPDRNADSLAELEAAFQLAFNASGTMMYGYNQTGGDLKSWTVSSQGVAA
jgi:hypothetical protein